MSGDGGQIADEGADSGLCGTKAEDSGNAETGEHSGVEDLSDVGNATVPTVDSSASVSLTADSNSENSATNQ